MLDWLFLRKDQCLFLSAVRQDKWYFASIAVRSPPLILVRSIVSCRSVAILLLFSSATKVILHHPLHKLQLLFPRDWCCKCDRFWPEFLLVMLCSYFLFLALCNLSLNLRKYDLCHLTWDATNISKIMPSPKQKIWFSLRNLLAFFKERFITLTICIQRTSYYFTSLNSFDRLCTDSSP